MAIERAATNAARVCASPDLPRLPCAALRNPLAELTRSVRLLLALSFARESGAVRFSLVAVASVGSWPIS